MMDDIVKIDIDKLLIAPEGIEISSFFSIDFTILLTLNRTRRN